MTVKDKRKLCEIFYKTKKQDFFKPVNIHYNIDKTFDFIIMEIYINIRKYFSTEHCSH